MVQLDKQENNTIPLLPGAFVSVTIYGKKAINSYKIPREALINGKFFFTIDTDSTLRKNYFTRLWGTEEAIVVDLHNDDTLKVAISHPQGETEGLKVNPLPLKKEDMND